MKCLDSPNGHSVRVWDAVVEGIQVSPFVQPETVVTSEKENVSPLKRYDEHERRFTLREALCCLAKQNKLLPRVKGTIIPGRTQQTLPRSLLWLV